MTILISHLLKSFTRINHGLCRGPNNLSIYLSHRHMQEHRQMQEFSERRVNNVMPEDYVLILSEPLNENEHTNELLKITKHEDIDYSKLDPETIFKGLSKALVDFENYLTDVSTNETTEVKPAPEFFKDLGRQLYPLDSAFNVAIALMHVESKKYNYKELFELINRYYKIRTRARHEGIFMESIQKYVVDSYEKMPEIDKKMVKMYYRKNIKSSLFASRDATTQLPEYKKHLANSVAKFNNNILLADNEFSHTVDDPDILASISSEFEDDQTLHHKERTPLKITPTTYPRFMRVCPDRFVRQMLWQTYNRRCSPKGPPKRNNYRVIDDIRVFGRKVADLSGSRSYLDYKLSGTMAQSKQRIMDMIHALNEENIKELNDRLEELTDFAVDNSGNNSETIAKTGLQEYDIDYWTHKYTHEILIGQSEAQLRQYFSFPVVMSGLKNYFKSYHGLEIKARDKEMTHWDENVQALDVKCDDRLIGSIVFDPYSRPSKLNLEPFYARIRCKSEESELAPIRMISTAFKHAQLSFSDIINLFYSFGTVIQRLLYNYDYYELNTYGALEADANQFFPTLCLAHLMTDHKILQSCSLRDESKPIDSELTSRLLKTYTYFRCFRIWRELYLAHLDLEVHGSLRDISKLVEDIYPIYSPFPRSPDNYDYCTYRSIFAGQNDGGVYAGLWSRQLVNFCLAESQTISENDQTKIRAFNEKLLDNLFAPDNFNTEDRLLSLLGRSFDPTKISARVV